MNETEKQIWGKIIGYGVFGPIVFAAVVTFLVAMALWRGFVVSCLYRWFAVPLGAPELSLGSVVGLGLLITLVFHRFEIRTLTEQEKKNVAVQAIVGPALVLLVGWFCKGRI